MHCVGEHVDQVEPERRGESRDKRLAILGGDPVTAKPWPRWPSSSPATQRALSEVLESQRWAINGPADGRPAFGALFEASFASYHGVAHCVAVTSGSAAIRIALQALGIGYGDAVLVPGLTWVACASAVLAAGAVPVFVDVEPATLCMSPEAARAALSPEVAAVLLVHAYCTTADLDAFSVLCREHHVALIEDCSQAHGALYRGRRVGSFGDVGVFSMQQTKVLTSGEGGAAITSSAGIADRMEQLRSDGRRQRPDARPGEESLEEVGAVQGYNACLSEFQAAILHERLGELDQANAIRERNARHLDACLADLGLGVPLRRSQHCERATYYKYCLRLHLDAFAGRPVENVCAALTAELGLVFSPIPGVRPDSKQSALQPVDGQARDVVDGAS